MINKLTDRCLLILAALICSGLIVLTIIFVEPRFSKEWSKFIYASIMYLVVLIATGVKAEQLKRLSKAKILFFQIVFYMLTVCIAFSMFKSGLLPLPKRGLTYVMPVTVLSVVSLIVLDYLRKRLKFFEDKSKFHSKRDMPLAAEDSKTETTDDSHEERMRKRFEYRDRH